MHVELTLIQYFKLVKWIHLVSTSIFYWARTVENVCRQMFSSLWGMTSGGHFSGNMRTFFMPHNISSKPIVWSWQGAPWKQIGCYIKFAIMTSALVSRVKKESKWESEREWRKEKLEKGDFQGHLQLSNGVSRSRNGAGNEEGRRNSISLWRHWPHPFLTSTEAGGQGQQDIRLLYTVGQAGQMDHLPSWTIFTK